MEGWRWTRKIAQPLLGGDFYYFKNDMEFERKKLLLGNTTASRESKLWKSYDTQVAADTQISEWQRGEDPESQWEKTYRVVPEGGRYVIYQTIRKKAQ